MKLVLNRKTLTRIKDFNAFKEIRSFNSLDHREIQQILIIDATIKYLQSLDIVSRDFEVEIGDI